MKKIFSFAIVLAAAAMISCGGNANQAAQAEAEAPAVEAACCGECAEKAAEECCAEKQEGCCGKAECDKAECDKEACAECAEMAPEAKAE